MGNDPKLKKQTNKKKVTNLVKLRTYSRRVVHADVWSEPQHLVFFRNWVLFFQFSGSF